MITLFMITLIRIDSISTNKFSHNSEYTMQRIFRRHKNQQATEQKKTKKTEKNALSSRLNIHLQAYEEHAASFNVISSSGEIDYQATAESMCASLKAFLQENKAMHNAYSIELEKLIDVI